jgi:hypothetical protein
MAKKTKKVEIPRLSGPRPSKRVHLSEIGKIPGLSVAVKAPDFGISLDFCNQSDDAFRVNLTGAVLTPRNEDYQRLLVVGTMHQVDAKGVHLPSTNVGHCVFVPPRTENVHVELDTCCMDEPLAPPEGNAYRVSAKLAPDRLLKAARARCSAVTLGKSAPVPGIGLHTVQSVCWDKETEEDKNVMEKVMTCGRF